MVTARVRMDFLQEVIHAISTVELSKSPIRSRVLRPTFVRLDVPKNKPKPPISTPSKGEIKNQAMSEWKADSAIIRFLGLRVDDGVFELECPHNGVAAGLPWQLVRNILHITLGKLLPERYDMICYYLPILRTD